jgi:RNA polymerase primary sigma factor/RNA polymerase nonessential primary-like sigma factor
MANAVLPHAPNRAEPVDLDGDADLVRRYLAQVAATPLLTAAEEVELAKRIEAGVYAAQLRSKPEWRGGMSDAVLAELVRIGERAKDQMIRANLRLVVSEAKRYAYRGLAFLDLVQEGNLGLIRAVEKFDFTKGVKFSTYAVWWIRQTIRRGLAAQARTIRLPVRYVEQLGRLARSEQRLRLELGTEPTSSELAEATGMSTTDIGRLRRLARVSVSLDMPVGEDGRGTVSDLIADPEVLHTVDVVEGEALAGQLRSLVDALPPAEALVLTLRYGLDSADPRTIHEVADQIGLSHERIRQLEKKALAWLRVRLLSSWAG